MLLPRHRHFLGYKIDTVWVKESLLGFVRVLARQIINEGLNIVVEADLRAAGKMLVSEFYGINLIGKKIL